MPLSLATWSRTRLRLMVGVWVCGTSVSLIPRPARAGGGPVCMHCDGLPGGLKLQLQMRPGDVAHRDAEGSGAFHVHRDRVPFDAGEHPGKVLAGRLADGRVRLHLHLLALRLLEMLRFLERPVE